MMTSTPIPKQANISTGTQVGLGGAFLGGGGVYRERLLLERGMRRGYRPGKGVGVWSVAAAAGFLLVTARLVPTGADISIRVPTQDRLARLGWNQRRAGDLQVVHSPPYRFLAIGSALKERFLADPLVGRLQGDAAGFGLGFKVEVVRVPAYRGTTTIRYAQPGEEYH